MKPNPFLFIATPMYGGQCDWSYAKGLLELQDLCRQRGFGFHAAVITGSSIITQARNELVAGFLASKATHLMFIDADIEFSARDVLQLLDFDRDVIGAPYATKKLDWNRVHDAVSAGCPRDEAASLQKIASRFAWRPLPQSQMKRGQPSEVESLATGFLLIARSVFEKFIAAFPQRSIASKSGDIPLIFDFRFDPATRQYWGEDYAFCLDWRALGGTIWACPWMRLGHIGSFSFQGSPLSPQSRPETQG
jgi:hypothetical protein